MKCKIAFFVEGRSELIFLYHLLFHTFPADNLMIKPYDSTGDQFVPSIMPKHNGQNPKIEFFLLNVNGSERVLTKIKENATNFLNKKYNYVCGLRDMFSQTYDDRSKGKINLNVTKQILRESQLVITSLNRNSAIFIFFAVMELEAWYFAFHEVFTRMGLSLTEIDKFIKPKYKVSLTSLDPETTFFKPKTDLKEIFKQITNKNFDETSFSFQFSKKITNDDIKNVISSSRVSHFRKFYNFLKSLDGSNNHSLCHDERDSK